MKLKYICETYCIWIISIMLLLFITVTRHHNASGHPAGTGHAGLCVEAVGGGGTWPGHWPQGGWPTDLQLHQEDRNGKETGKSEILVPVVINDIQGIK